MSVWDLLKQYVREFEVANNVMFSDGSWQRIKKLETDILAVNWTEVSETRELYQKDNELLRAFLKSTLKGHIRIIDTPNGMYEARLENDELVIEKRDDLQHQSILRADAGNGVTE